MANKIGTADTRKLEDTKGWDFRDDSGSGNEALVKPFNPEDASVSESFNQTLGTIKTADIVETKLE